MGQDRDAGTAAGLQERSPAHEERAAARVRRMAQVLFTLIVALVAAGFFFILRFADQAMERDLAAWGDRLAVIAASRAAAVDDWIAGESAVIAGIARNPTVQFFLTEYGWVGGLEKITDGAARLAILNSYLSFTAEENGFTALDPKTEIGAEPTHELASGVGIALVAADGRLLLATAVLPPLAPLLDAYRAAPVAHARGVYIQGLYRSANGAPALAFVAPVFPIESSAAAGSAAGHDSDAPIGYVVAVRLAGADLFGRLVQPGDAAGAGGETVLVRREADLLDYLSPLDDGTPPLSRHGDPDDPDLAAAFAVLSPGVLGQKIDHAGRAVLVSGRPLLTMPWTVVRTVDADQALGASRERRTLTLAIFGLVGLCLGAGVLLLWRHGASLRATAAAARAEALARELTALNDFLHGLSDSQPTAIIAFDGDGRCQFANSRARTEARAANPERYSERLIGLSATAIFGPSLGAAIAADSARARASGVSVSRNYSLEGLDAASARPRVFKAEHVPLLLPGRSGLADQRGVLVVLDDLSELIYERERRENNLRQLVTTLAGIIDSRDPYAARQSRWVAEVAEAMAGEMGLSDVEVETAEIAGALMNLGKVLVPRRLLTKTAALTAEELAVVRSGLIESADLLTGVDFNGPVVATIRQVQAQWDGNGIPAGLAGSDILLTARVVAVANAFVGMISARSHRAPLSVEEVLTILAAKVGTLYDRRPVAALVAYLGRSGRRELWEQRSAATMAEET